jgi:Domain of unknown function (DUF4148)
MYVTRPLSLIAIAAAVAASGTALAEQGKTRAQVQAELAEAVRTGDISTGNFGFKRNEIAPGLYPAKTPETGKTREQVKAELTEALRTGDIVIGDFGFMRNDIAPSLYASGATPPGKTREQVRSELVEAVRSGDISAGDIGFKRNEIAPWLYPLPTPTRDDQTGRLNTASGK